MSRDKRKSRRKPLGYSAWIHTGNPKPLGCAVADISESGARLNVDAPQDVPDRFVLFLSRSGTPRRQCRTVWRTADQVGVVFEKPGKGERTAKEAPQGDYVEKVLI